MSEAQNAITERDRMILVNREIAAAIDGMIDIRPSPEQIADRAMPSHAGVDELYRAATWLYLREEAERQLAARAHLAEFTLLGCQPQGGKAEHRRRELSNSLAVRPDPRSLVWTSRPRSARPFYCLTAPAGDVEYSIIPRIKTTGELEYTVYVGKPGQGGKRKFASVAQLERAKELAQDDAFGRKLLTLIAAAGDNGMELQELVAATGGSVEEVEDMLKRLQAAGCTQSRARH